MISRKSSPRSLFVFIGTASLLAGCAPIDFHSTFYNGEEWSVENRITLNPEQRSQQGAVIEAEIEKKAVEWRKRDIRYDWRIEKRDDNTAYVVNAAGRGWQTLNELVFDKRAMIQATNNPGEISFSYSSKDALPTSLRLTGRKIVSSNADEIRDNTAIWKNIKSRERVEAVLTERSKFPLSLTCLGGSTLFLFAPVFSLFGASGVALLHSRTGFLTQ